MLDDDHYGLEKVKERIVEYLAVQQRSQKQMKGPIMCSGRTAPGVGKTSLGKSVARATGRENLFASVWEVCATRARSEAIGGPTSARCRARSFRHLKKAKDHQSVNIYWMRSTRWARISAVIRRRRCSRFWILSRTRTFVDHYLEVEYDLIERDVFDDGQLVQHAGPAFGPNGDHSTGGLH